MLQLGSGILSSSPLKLELRKGTQSFCSGEDCQPVAQSFLMSDIRNWDYSPATCSPEESFQDSVSLHTRSSCETHSLYVMVYN
ncbi:hypothetical protein GBAR_LOCUS22630, partial [Geodia barretti]